MSETSPSEAASDAGATKPKKKKAPMGGIPADLPGAGTAEGERLRAAYVSFEIGDYASVREAASALKGSSDARVADAAAELARRVSVDAVQIGFLVACFVALAVIASIYIPT